MREWFQGRGIATLQCYAIADLGLVAYESPAREGMIVDEGVIVEIVRPGTGEPVAEGEVGEVLVTTLTPEYPLIRFATGDLSAVLPGASPCGRTNMRIKGWMGRADQTAKVKGMFVKPAQIADVAKRHREIRKYRLTIDHDEKKNDRMTLHCEVEGGGETLAAGDCRYDARGVQSARRRGLQTRRRASQRRQSDRRPAQVRLMPTFPNQLGLAMTTTVSPPRTKPPWPLSIARWTSTSPSAATPAATSGKRSPPIPRW